MTRLGILRILVYQAGKNGFDFRKWHQEKIGSPWSSLEDALADLAEGRHYYALLFSHEFARSFWKEGAKIAFVVPGTIYTQRGKDGEIVRVTRKAYTRRTMKADAWKYHLREMSAHDEPLRYIRRFLAVVEDVKDRKPSNPEMTIPHRASGPELAREENALVQAEEMIQRTVPLSDGISRP